MNFNFNFYDVESASTTTRIIKPWGYEDIIIITPHYVIKHLYIDAGKRLSLQHHEKKVETMMLLSGKVIIEHSSLPSDSLKSVTLRPGDSFHVPEKTLHRVHALERSIICEVSTNDLEDLVRHSDDYNRI